jgi:hypothetical protein
VVRPPWSTLVRATREQGLAKDRVLAALAHDLAARIAPEVDRSMAGPLLDGSIEPADLDGFTATVDPDPRRLGDALELLHDRADRRPRGAFFTPHASAAALVERATLGWRWPKTPHVCDPSCGGGAFLLAAADELERRGHARRRIVDELLWGVDSDALSVAVAQAALVLWAGGNGVAPSPNVVRGDTLRSGLESWPERTDPFDLVVGNPPFQSQLASRTARSRAAALELGERFGSVSRGYADNATLFLVASAAMTRAGGRLALLLPESFLAARDARPARRALSESAALVGLWLPRERLFAASVRVCAPVFELGRSQPSTISRWRGADAEPVSDGVVPPVGLGRLGAWAGLVSDLFGAPEVEVREGPSVGSIATATAGFRDQFYGVVPFVQPATQASGCGVRLMTSGAIDLVNDLWARRVTKFAGRSLRSPVVDVERLSTACPELAAWADRVLVPKVVLATQTKIIELIVDETGEMWPSVPTIAVVAPRDQLWRVAAALASPAVSALALARHAGVALAGDAIKLSASQVLDLPLPHDDAAWNEGAELLRSASGAAEDGDGEAWRSALARFGVSMGRAHRTSDEVVRWWLARVPAFR